MLSRLLFKLVTHILQTRQSEFLQATVHRLGFFGAQIVFEHLHHFLFAAVMVIALFLGAGLVLNKFQLVPLIAAVLIGRCMENGIENLAIEKVDKLLFGCHGYTFSVPAARCRDCSAGAARTDIVLLIVVCPLIMSMTSVVELFSQQSGFAELSLRKKQPGCKQRELGVGGLCRRGLNPISGSEREALTRRLRKLVHRSHRAVQVSTA